MDFFILRHGQAQELSATVKSDSKRMLTVAGKKEVEDIAKGIKNLGIQFDYVVTSPLKRSQQTAIIVSDKLKTKNSLLEWNELKPEGARDEFYKKISKLKDDSSVLIVGHEPYLSTLIGEIITNGKSYCSIDLKKGGLAKIRIISKHPKFHGELKWLMTPRQVKKITK